MAEAESWPPLPPHRSLRKVLDDRPVGIRRGGAQRWRYPRMTGPPAAGPSHDSVSRGSREEQPRAYGESGRVRVVSDDDVLIDVCLPDRLGRYLTAPNAEV